MKTIPRWKCLLIVALLAGCSVRSIAQCFTVSTTVTPSDGQYVYDFTVAYDHPGGTHSLTDPIWQWTFYMEPYSQPPAVVNIPDGWSFSYQPATGEFCWYTQGTDGWVMGDFGGKVIASGQSVTGFRIKTPLPAADNLANAFDTQSHQDIATASLPASVYGDLDSNGVFNVDDVVTAVRIAAGLQPTDQMTYGRGDATMDGEVTLADAVYLIRRLGSL